MSPLLFSQVSSFVLQTLSKMFLVAPCNAWSLTGWAFRGSRGGGDLEGRRMIFSMKGYAAIRSASFVWNNQTSQSMQITYIIQRIKGRRVSPCPISFKPKYQLDHRKALFIAFFEWSHNGKDFFKEGRHLRPL